MKKLLTTLVATLSALFTFAGNPVLPGFHADPEVLFAEQTGKYYIYSTTDGMPGWGGWTFSVFSSDDLKTWKDEGVMLDAKSDQVPWATGNAWAPCIIERKTVAADKSVKYQYYFYLYWGNGFMAGAELNDDMVSIKPETKVNLTPKGGSLRTWAYREGAYVFYRQGKYYFMWSVDDTGSPNYHVCYGTSASPLGPINIDEKNYMVISQVPDQKIYGTAHNSVILLPSKFKKGKKGNKVSYGDDWRIVYHRINPGYLKDGPGVHREVCIDVMKFDKNGNIIPVVPTN